MKLEKVSFRYEIPKKKFNNIYYTFKPLEKVANTKELVQLAKTHLQDIESLITPLYKDKLKKEEEGEIDSYNIKYGHKYITKTKKFSSHEEVFSIELYYHMEINTRGVPTSLEINLSNSNKNNMLKLHDSILVIPDLKITPEAQKQLENIEYLRNHKFDASKYLLLK